MATLEQIERDIAALGTTVKALAAELYNAYISYLAALERAVRQQLILASYHLCTQGYPEAFLSLSFSQRQQLQQAIQKLGQKAADQLLAQIKIEEIETREETGTTEQEMMNIASDPNRQTVSNPSSLSNPMDLVRWQQNLEQAIANTLKMVSRESNSLLQQAGVLPSKLPPPVLEAALDASEAAGEAMASPPNLLKLVIETENKEESRDSTVTHIVAINMRLSEIEFTDATARAGRNQIRNLDKARLLLREYLKKQQERAVAEAEAAWRASWFEG